MSKMRFFEVMRRLPVKLQSEKKIDLHPVFALFHTADGVKQRLSVIKKGG